MTNRRLTSMQEAARHLLDTLLEGQPVSLEIAAQDESTGGLLRLITEIHDAARERRVAVRLEPMGERGVRLSLANGITAG